MQIEEGLAFPLASLANGTPLTATQLNSIIELYPESQATPQVRAMLKLLHIAEQTLVLEGETSVEDSLGLILRAVVGKLKLEEPLRWLAACEFDQFREYCARMQDNELRSALQWSFGLYPRVCEQHPKPSSIFLQKNGGSLGNPHWLFSRKALRDYYRIKSSKMNGSVKKVYMFLQSDRELLDGWRNEPLKLLWGELYVLYNGLLLEPHLKEARISGENEVITWMRPNFSDVLNQIKQIEPNLPLEERMLLNLIQGILSQREEWREEVEGSWFQDAFRAFLQGYNNLPQWHNLMAFLFFTNISKKLGFPSIQQQCRKQFKALLSYPYSLDKLIPFLYFFLSEEEVLQVIHEKDLEYWRIPLPQGVKKAAANYLIERGVFHARSLRYVSPEDLRKYLFQSPKILENPIMGQNVMTGLGKLQSEVLQHIKHFGLPQEQGRESYLLFLQLWNSYYKLLQGENGNFELAESILVSHEVFHPNLNSLHLPTDNPNAILNILLIIAKAYRAKMQDVAELPPYILRKLRNFRQKILPDLLQKLSTDQCVQFQREWMWFSTPEAQAILEE